MFTVKHIQEAFNSSSPRVENLYMGERITFQPADDNIGALEIRTGDTFIVGLWGGTAYVMNAEGKTVARYDLPHHPHAPANPSGQL